MVVDQTVVVSVALTSRHGFRRSNRYHGSFKGIEVLLFPEASPILQNKATRIAIGVFEAIITRKYHAVADSER